MPRLRRLLSSSLVALAFAAPAVAEIPLTFEPVGPGGATFVARGDGYVVALDRGGLTVDAGGAPVRVVLSGAAQASPTGEAPMATAHRLVGPSAGWQRDIPLYSRVRQTAVWEGIDVVFYGAGRHVEWDYVVAPGADPGAIAFRVEGGATRIDERGDLLIDVGNVELRQQRPVAYQRRANGERVPVDASYAPQPDGRVGIEIGAYDRASELVIDPVLVFSTYLGGSGGEFWVSSNVAGIALDASGNVVVAGDTATPNFPNVTATDLRAAGGSRDVFVARLSADGSTLLSLTYLGGSGLDDRASVAIAPDGSIFVSGRTLSPNLPVTPGGSPHSGGADAFVYKLDATASTVQYVTYVGGAGDESANALTVDSLGRPLLVGSTTSAADTFPETTGAPQTTAGGATDAFVALLDPTTGAVSFASFLGGSGADDAYGVKANALGQVFVVGTTQSANFPLAGALQGAISGTADAFVSVMAPGTSTLLASTYFGGAGGAAAEYATDVAIGPGESLYVSGVTDSPSFPATGGSAQAASGGQLDGFVAKFGWNGTALSTTYATYLGGAGNDAAFALGVAPDGTATVTGGTQSAGFPPDAGAFDSTLGGTQDAFVVRLNPAGSSLTEGSYAGGSGIDVGLALALDAVGDAYVIGQTTSNDLVTTSLGGTTPWDTTPNGAEDAFVFRVSSDQDRDGLPDTWETDNDLDPTDPTGDNGAAGDPDRDQLTNIEEFHLGTDPMLAQRFFAEGAVGTGIGFETRFAVLNPWTDVTVDATFRFMTNTGQLITFPITGIGPGERRTLLASTVPGLLVGGTAQFSTEIQSRHGVIADRTMTWDGTGYGSHAETAVTRPGTTWYLAEGATHSNFSLFYLLQNPAGEAATVRVTYLRPSPKTPLEKAYTVPANSRFNIWVNEEGFPADTDDKLLASEEVSAVIEVLTGPSIIVERAMYQTPPGQPGFSAGHESAGVRQTSTRWFLAEGATNPDYFSEFILLANPSQTEANVTVTYLLETGETIVKRYGGATPDYPALGPRSRTTVFVNLEDPKLANAAVSTIVESTNAVGIIVERAMWWPGNNWVEAHNSPGTTTTGRVWALAEGELAGTSAWDTYILIANTSAFAGCARVTLHYEDGTTEAAIVTLDPSSRRTVGVGYQPEFTKAAGQRFGAVVESLAATDGGVDVPAIVVERAMYSADATNAFIGLFPPTRPYWPAGTNAVATKIQ